MTPPNTVMLPSLFCVTTLVSKTSGIKDFKLALLRINELGMGSKVFDIPEPKGPEPDEVANIEV